jgi:hypothetical protein
VTNHHAESTAPPSTSSPNPTKSTSSPSPRRQAQPPKNHHHRKPNHSPTTTTENPTTANPVHKINLKPPIQPPQASAKTQPTTVHKSRRNNTITPPWQHQNPPLPNSTATHSLEPKKIKKSHQFQAQTQQQIPNRTTTHRLW